MGGGESANIEPACINSFSPFFHAASAFPGKRKEKEEGDCCFSKGKRRVGCPGLEKEKVSEMRVAGNRIEIGRRVCFEMVSNSSDFVSFLPHANRFERNNSLRENTSLP